MKKIASFLILTAMLLSIFSACSVGSAPELLSFIAPDEGSVDLMGEHLIFIQEGLPEDALYAQSFGTQMYDEVKARLGEIEKRYNCTIEVKYSGTGDEYILNFTNSVATGDIFGDVIYASGANKMSLFASAGLLYPLTELKEYIDYENSAKFGTAGLLEAGMWKGIPYAVQPVQWLGYENSWCYVIAYNPFLLNQYGLPNLHEFYETKTWTWENYEELFKMYNNSDRPERVLLAANKGRHGFLSLYSNGVKFCSYDDNGNAKCDINFPNSLTAIDWHRRMYIDYADKIASVDIWDTSTFTSGNALMSFASTAEVTNGSIQYSSNIEFNIMPFPCGPDGVYGQWANWIEGLRGFAIPANSDIPEAAARMINDLCDPFENITVGGDLASYYNEYVFFDPLDTEIILEVGKFTRAYYYQNSQGMREFMHALNKEDLASAAEVVSANYSFVSAFVEEELMPNYVGYIHEHLYETEE